MERPVYVIDGRNFSTLDGFYDEVGGVLASGDRWGRNLDAFNDILSWPQGPYTLVWRDSGLSRLRLGHPEMAEKLSQMLRACHPTNETSIAARLERAKKGEGPTLFDWLVEIIRDNGRHVALRLE